MPPRADLLLIEDDPADVYMFRKSLEPHLKTGLHCEPRAAGLPAVLKSVRPRFVVTDMNLPGADGASVALTVRRSEADQALPVIVCSTSGRPDDVARAYAAGANAYVRKPADLDGWTKLAGCLACFWGELNLKPV